MTRAFTILDKFVLEGKGIALLGVPFPELVDCSLSEGAGIEVRSAGAVVVRTKIVGFELMRNCWSPQKPRGMAVLVDTDDFELPKVAEVWVGGSDIKQPTR